MKSDAVSDNINICPKQISNSVLLMHQDYLMLKPHMHNHAKIQSLYLLLREDPWN